MKDKMRFILQGFSKNIVSYNVLFIQITISFILLGFAVTQLDEMSGYTQAMNGMLNTDKLYYIEDNTDYNRLAELEDNSKYRDKWAELYSFIFRSDKYKAYSLSDDTLYIVGDDTPEVYRSSVGRIEPEDEHGISYKKIPSVEINENMAVSFNLKCKYGRMLNSSDMNEKSRNIVLGANYSDEFKVGDKITILNEAYNVVGILEEKSYFLNPMRTSTVLYLDDYIVFPDYIYIDKEDDSNTEYSGAITRASFYADSEQLANEIPKKARELGLLDIEVKSCGEKYKDVREAVGMKIAVTSCVAGIILAFAVICMISAMLLIVQRQMNDFVIHYMCGARLSDIISQIGIPVTAIISLGFIITAVIYRSLSVSAVIFAFAIMIAFIIIAVPAVKIKRLSISEMLKGRN